MLAKLDVRKGMNDELPFPNVNPSKTERKCCGNCFWATDVPKESEHDVSQYRPRVDCIWDVPNRTPDSLNYVKSFMYADEGSNCPCFRFKETPNVT
jgi:hypothetical protein